MPSKTEKQQKFFQIVKAYKDKKMSAADVGKNVEDAARTQPTERNITIERSSRIPSTSSRGFESPSSSQSRSTPRNSRSSSLPNSNTLSGGRSTSTEGKVINQ